MDLPIKVLVVEDNPADVRLLQVALSTDTRSRYDVDAVGSLREALRLVDAYDYHVLLVDLTLPDSTGLESFQRLHDFAPDVPAVILTQTEDDELALAAVARGAQDYLVKGQEASLLIRAVRHGIERQRVLHELRCQVRQPAA